MAKTPKPKWKMEFRISRIDGKPLTKADKELADKVAEELKKIAYAEVTVNGK